MDKIIKVLTIILLVVLIAIGVKFLMPVKNQGFFEKTGQTIDKQINKVEEKLDKEGPAERAGRKFDEAIESAEQKLKELQKKE